MSLQSSVDYVSQNPCILGYMDHAEHIEKNDSPLVENLELPVVCAKNKRMKEFVDIIPDMPVLTKRQYQQCLSEIIASDLSPEQLTYTPLALLAKCVDHALAANKIDKLPWPLRPEITLPEGTHMSISLVNMTNGSVTVVKSFYNNIPLTLGVAKQICVNFPQIWDYKRAANSDMFRKAVAHMLANTNGQHWLYQAIRLQPRRSDSGSLSQPFSSNSERQKKEWNPTSAQLKAGIEYINFKAPLCDGMNEQFLWILLNIRDECSPVFGWPQHVVSKAAHNRSSNKSQVSTILFFPLLMLDLCSVFLSDILPQVMPLLLEHGLLLLGISGKGKTPFAIMLGMALSRMR